MLQSDGCGRRHAAYRRLPPAAPPVEVPFIEFTVRRPLASLSSVEGDAAVGGRVGGVAGVVDEAMVVRTQEPGIREVGRTASGPGPVVVRMADGGGESAAVGGAAAVPDGEGLELGG